MVERSKTLTIRISEDEVAMLQALAEADGITSSDVLRLYIRRAHQERFGSTTPKRAKR